MSAALIGHIAGNATGADTSTSLTGSLDTSTATAIFIALSWYATGAGTLSDNKSNSWTGLTGQTHAAFTESKIFYSLAPTVGAGHTFQFVQSGSFPVISVAAFSGVLSVGAFDAQNGATGADIVATGSVTPSTDGQVLIAGLTTFGTGAISIDLGFTITDSVANLASNHVGGGLAYLIETSAAAKNPSWTTSVGGATCATIATFKAASTAAALLNRETLLRQAVKRSGYF